MDWDYARQLGRLAHQAEIALSVHAPIPAFLGHLQRAKKYRMALGMLDHSAGVAVGARSGRSDEPPPPVPAAGERLFRS
jgi:hypothetical protein